MQGIAPTESVFDHSSDAANPIGSGFLFSGSDPRSIPPGPVVSAPFTRRSSGSTGSPRKTPTGRRKALIAACLIALILCGLITGTSWLKGRRHASTAQAPALPSRSSTVADLFQPQKAFTIQGTAASQFVVFGGGGSTTVAFAAPNGRNTITMPAASGTICLDSDNCGYVKTADLGQDLALQGGPGVSTSGRTITNSGVLAVNGLAGRLSIQGTANQVSISTAGNTITVGGPQDLATSSTPAFAGLKIAGVLYTWPGSSSAGVLTNNGSGILTWSPTGACASCFTNGGNSFGSTATLGTTDANDLAFITNGTTRLTVTSGGTSTFTGPVVASSFSGNGAGVSNVDAVTLGGNSTSYFTNASNLSTGTVSDSRLSGNVALLNAANQFTATQSIIQGSASNTGLALKVTGDAADRFQVAQDGSMLWGDGTNSADLTVWNEAAGRLSFKPDMTASAAKTTSVAFYGYGASGSIAPGLSFRSFGGTPLSPAQTPANSLLGNITFNGADDTLAVNTGASLRTYTSEAWTTTARGAGFYWMTTATGGTALSEKMRLAPGGTLQVASTATSVGTVEKLRVNTPTTTDNAAATILSSGATTSKTLVLQGVASQTVALQEWQNSAGTVLARINPDGRFLMNTTSNTGLFNMNIDTAARVGFNITAAASQTANLFQLLDSSTNLKLAVNSNGSLLIGAGSSPTVGTVEKLRINAPTTVDNSANVMIATSATTSRGLVVQGVASQSANLQEWQDSTGAVKSWINSTGSLGFSSSYTPSVYWGSQLVWAGVGATASMRITPYNSAFVGLQVKGVASQAADLFQVQDSGGAVLASIGSGGLFTGTAGATISGATINLNASSNFATNINTGTSTGAVTIGNGSAGAINVQSASTIGLTGTTTVTGLSSGVALTVNNSTSTGNVLNLQDNGTNVLTVADGGAIALTNTVDSTSAFSVSNLASQKLLTVDTTNGQTILRSAKDSPTLGSELVTSQDFSNATYWTCSTGWTTTTTTATHNTGNSNTCAATASNFTVSAATRYEITFTISGLTAGNITPSIGGVSGSPYFTNATYTVGITTTGTGALTFSPTSTFDGTISAISVKTSTGTSTPVLSVQNQSGTESAQLRVTATNLALGRNNLQYTTSGTYNTAIGQNSLQNNTTGFNNTANGSQSLYANTTGYQNTATGYRSLYSNTTGYYNTALGDAAIYANTTGYYNTASGMASLYSNTSGYSNSAMGYVALYANTSGDNNTAAGMASLYSNTTGYSNTASGMNALYGNTTGYSNTALGFQAGRYIADGSTANQTSNTSVYLGRDTKANASGDTNEVVIGYNAIGNGSNTVTLGNSSITNTYLQGTVTFNSATTDITTGTNQDLTLLANGTGNIILNDSVIVGASSGTPGTVEKFRVNTPTTVDNSAVAIFSASSTTDKPLVLQGVAGQSVPLLTTQNSTGTF